MIVFTPDAGQQVRDLRQHYEERDRTSALRGLNAALEAAWGKVVANPAIGLAASRPCPQLARPGPAWIKTGRYWIAYNSTPLLAIVGVSYETADIPGRV